MKINLINIENGLQGIGFRKFSSSVKQVNPETNVYFISPANQLSLLNRILLRPYFSLTDYQIESISGQLANADLIGLSFMSECRDIAKKLSENIKAINPKALVISGGTHSRIYPDDSISFSDAVCTSEGELAFREFYALFSKGKDYKNVSGMNFKVNGNVVTNLPRAPLSNDELESMPFIDYDRDNYYYNAAKNRFDKIDSKVYRQWLGLNLNLLWSRGCPNTCSYCYNSSYIDYHVNHRYIRYPSPEYIIREIEHVRKIHPMISWVSFIDDGLLGINTKVLEHFSKIYPERVGLPFLTYGTHPNYISEEKVKLLVKAGNVFFRLGIQNMNDQILNIYNRNTPIERISNAAAVISKFKKYLSPPGYDLILDNAFSTIEQRRDHLEKLYRLARPYVLNLHSLRIVPGTMLAKNIEKLSGPDFVEIKDKNLLKLRMTFFNISHYLISTVKIPKWCMGLIIKYGCNDKREHEMLGLIFRFIFLIRRAFGNIVRMDFSFVNGPLSLVPYFLWKTKVLKLYNAHDLKRRKSII